MRSIECLKQSESRDAYVLGSGASLNYMNPSFFYDKLTIGVNLISKFLPCTYTVTKWDSKELIQSLIDKGDTKVVVSRERCGNTGELADFSGYCYVFDHCKNEEHIVDLSVIDSSSKLVVSWSTMTSAIHFAYFLGCKNIILCGHDCGLIDGKTNLSGYYETDISQPFVARYEDQTIKLVQCLRKLGVNVVSLNPFINFGLEGHLFTREG